MSYIVARMQKMKADNLVGIGNHNQRKTENHSNKDIDIERSHLNYDLVEGRTENYKTDIQNFIDENKSTSRAVRKDAVLVNEWIISSDGDFFEDKDDKEVERFFEEAKDYFADKFGDKNIRYAQVHLDETTPHMHLGVVPFDKDNKLSAKRVFGRQALRDVQDDLPRFLNERDFAIQRGEKGSERKNLTVPEYKKAKDDLKVMTKELEQKKSEVLALTNKQRKKIDKDKLGLKYETETVKVPSGKVIDGGSLFQYEVKEKKEQKTGNVIMSEKTLDGVIRAHADLHNANQQLKKYVETDLPQRLQEITRERDEMWENYNSDMNDHFKVLGENRELKEENQELKEQVKSLKGEIKTIYQTVKKHFTKGLKNDLKRVKGVMSTFAKEIGEKLPDSQFSRLDKQETRQERNRGGRSR